MRNYVALSFVLLSLLLISHSVTAQMPPLMHRLDSGSTLILAPVPEADYVSVQIFIDKRSFKHDLLKQIYVNAYLRRMEQKAWGFEGAVRLLPLEIIPESVYNPQEEQYLNFKTTSLYFNEHRKSILKLFLGKWTDSHFPLKGRPAILEKARLANFMVPYDSLSKIVRHVRFGDFENFVNSVSLRSQVYLYIAGNIDLFRTVEAAQQLSPEFNEAKEMADSTKAGQVMSWYWSFVFWRFALDMLKENILPNVQGKPLRLYAPLTMGKLPIQVRLMRAYKQIDLSRVLSDALIRRFDRSFAHWYRGQFFYELKWMFADADQKGFFRLLSTAYSGRPDAVFAMVENPDWARVKTRFRAFVKRLRFKETGK